MTSFDALVIFAKNPQSGRVKTRLAATIGNKAALDIYLQLLQNTLDVAQQVAANCMLFVAGGTINLPGIYFEQVEQTGSDLGEKMANAFSNLFSRGYKKVVIIGTDCPGINPGIIQQGFLQLSTCDVVVGPAHDGGYYLIGLQQPQPGLFTNICWSTPEVLDDTLSICHKHNLSFHLLPTLHDVDTEQDLIHLSNQNG